MMPQVFKSTSNPNDFYPKPKVSVEELNTFSDGLVAFEWNDQQDDAQLMYTLDEIKILMDFMIQKVDGCAQYADTLEDHAARARDYARKFTDIARQCEARYEKFLSYIKQAMERHGFEKLPGDAFQVAIRQNPVAVITYRSPTADDALSELERYIKTKISYEWDKTAIKEAMKAGITLDFANLETTTRAAFSVRKK